MLVHKAIEKYYVNQMVEEHVAKRIYALKNSHAFPVINPKGTQRRFGMNIKGDGSCKPTITPPLMYLCIGENLLIANHKLADMQFRTTKNRQYMYMLPRDPN